MQKPFQNSFNPMPQGKCDVHCSIGLWNIFDAININAVIIINDHSICREAMNVKKYLHNARDIWLNLEQKYMIYMFFSNTDTVMTCILISTTSTFAMNSVR